MASSCLTGDPRDITVTSRPAVTTITDERSILLATVSSILAGRCASAPVDWSLAAVASVALGAGATEGFQGILTDASVEARLGVTLINLILAVRASEA